MRGVVSYHAHDQLCCAAVRTVKAQWQHLMDCIAEMPLNNDINGTDSDKHYVFIWDYAQNIKLPFLGDQQPGETYFLSPKHVYVFGIVDISHDYNDC